MAVQQKVRKYSARNGIQNVYLSGNGLIFLKKSLYCFTEENRRRTVSGVTTGNGLLFSEKNVLIFRTERNGGGSQSIFKKFHGIRQAGRHQITVRCFLLSEYGTIRPERFGISQIKGTETVSSVTIENNSDTIFAVVFQVSGYIKNSLAKCCVDLFAVVDNNSQSRAIPAG